MVKVYKGYSGHIGLKLGAKIRRIARLDSMRMRLNNNIEAYYEVGTRHPVELMPGRLEINGSFTVAVWDKRVVQAVVGQYGSVFDADDILTSGAGVGYVDPEADFNLKNDEIGGVGGAYRDVPYLYLYPRIVTPLQDDPQGQTIMGIELIIKPNSWDFLIRQSDWLQQTVDFIGLRISKINGLETEEYWDQSPT